MAAGAGTITDIRAVVLDASGLPALLRPHYQRCERGAATPEWMKRRLERCGIRSISALVDVTNYVMLELGQPLHAFDNKLEACRPLACPGETALLNEQTIAIDSDVLMIADDAKPLAMAGIMGGEESGITLETGELFLESAFFAQKAIAGRARRYGFSSDTSHRFERGVDFGGGQTCHRAGDAAHPRYLRRRGRSGGRGGCRFAAAGTGALAYACAPHGHRCGLECGSIAALFVRLGLQFSRKATIFW